MSKRAAKPRQTPSADRARASSHNAVPLDRLFAAGLALLYVGFAWFLANATPLVESGSLINAPDEAAHVGYVRAIASGHRLPTRFDAEYRTYQWHQPPLYYAVASVAYPLGLPGLRAVSVLFGLISLWAIWSTARILLPKNREAVIFVTASAALLPMRHAVYASVGNDAAIECMLSIGLLLCASVCVNGFTRVRGIGLGLLLGAATLTKLSGLLLFPGAALCVMLAGPAAAMRARLARATLPLLLGLGLSGPWFALNAARYGQILPIKAFHEEFANTSRAADWIGKRALAVDMVSGELEPGPIMDRRAYTTLVGNWTVRTFFGAYTPPSRAAIGAPVFLPGAFYLCYIGLGLIALLGLLFAGKDVIGSGPFRAYLLAAGVSVFLVMGSFAGFTWTYFQAQGRYLYPVLSPLALAWGLGFASVIPKRYQGVGAVGVIALLVVLASAFAFVYVAPAYSAR